jgi:hypothetical protein
VAVFIRSSSDLEKLKSFREEKLSIAVKQRVDFHVVETDNVSEQLHRAAK